MSPHEVGDRVRAVVEDRNELLDLLTEVADSTVLLSADGCTFAEIPSATFEAIQRRVAQDRASA